MSPLPSRFAPALLAALLVPLVACSPAPPAAPAEAEAGAAAPPTNRIDIPASVRANLGITFAQVELRHVTRTLRVPGAFELEPRARHEYHMALPGRVELQVDQYERVVAGQPLFRYRSPRWPELLHEVLAGEQQMATAAAEIDVGTARLTEVRAGLALARERIEALAQADFKKAELEVQAAELQASIPRLEAELRLAETKLENARRTREHALHRAAAAAGIPDAELSAEVERDGERVPAWRVMEWIEVRALEPGVVEALAVTDGAFVEPPAVVLATVDPALVRFRAVALQGDLPRLARAEAARIVPPAAPGIPAGAGVDAAVAIGLEAHAEERTVALLAAPAQPASWIRPGVSAYLEVVLEGTDGPALAIPRSAVLQDGLVHVFFRRDPADPNKAIRVEADLGPSDGRWVALNSGVMRGDEVVLDGAYELKLATQQSGGTGAGGHFHADGSFHGEH